MELRQLRYFLAVADLQNFRRAAEALHIAQPAISRQIKLLEDEVGTPLLERTPTGARLTDVGALFLKDVRQILASVADARARAIQAATSRVEQLRISFTNSPPSLVPEAILEFQIAKPDVTLSLLALESPAQLLALRQNRTDAAFLNLGPEDASDLERVVVKIDRIVLAIPALHPLAGKATLHLHDLTGEPLVLFSRIFNPSLYDTLIATFREAGLAPRIVQEVSASAVILDLVSVGLGIGIVTTAISGREPVGVILREVADLNISYQLDLAWRGDNTLASLASLVDLVTAMVRRRRI